MKFRQKIWMLPATAAVLFVAGSAASYFVGVATSGALNTLRSEAYPFKESVDRFAISTEAFRAAVQAAAAEGDAAKVDEAKAVAKAARTELASIAALPSFAAQGQQLQKAMDAYEPAALAAAQAIVGKGDAGDAMQRMTAGKAALDKVTAEVKERATAAVGAQQEAASRGVDRGLLIQLLTGLVTLAALGVASVMVTRSVWKDLGEEPDELRRLTERVAEGDLAAAVVGRHEGSQSLRVALGRMAQKLQETVSGIRQGASSISGASSEIAAGNQDLSARTERTAASLQQTASAMEEMTTNVRQTAASAKQASELARLASSTAQRGGEVVHGVVANMDEISAASGKIGEIIGVIDGIAFQTNILALNAAVEAARAGEQGRGFAVVASEVRSLAQRSAAAAREIKQLIAVSAEKVEGGSRLVRDAGSVMGEIVGNVQHVAQIIEEITTAAAEQSNGIGHVNDAVVKLDEMTQQNAALVEQSAAAAGSLLSQANALVDSVAVFSLSEGAHAAV